MLEPGEDAAEAYGSQIVRNRRRDVAVVKDDLSCR